MASTTSSVKPEKLLSSKRAAYFHFLHVYYQVQEWKIVQIVKILKIVQTQPVGAGNFRMEH